MKDLILRLLRRFKRFILFGFVGCINTLVDFLVFTLAHAVLIMSPAWSQAVGYASGICCSFILNRRLTFRDGNGSPWAQFIRFLAVNGVSLLVSTQLIRWLTALGMNAYIAKVAVTAVVMVINYFGYKLLVFHVREKGEDNRKGNRNHE